MNYIASHNLHTRVYRLHQMIQLDGGLYDTDRVQTMSHVLQTGAHINNSVKFRTKHSSKHVCISYQGATEKRLSLISILIVSRHRPHQF